MTTAWENIYHRPESKEHYFERHDELMKHFRRYHARVETIDSRFVEKVNWWAFITIRIKIRANNLQN